VKSCTKIRLAVVGLGKMGLSHLSMTRVHPNVNLVAVCDTSKMFLSILEKNTGVTGYSDFKQMMEEAKPDAVFVATPSRHHEGLVRIALENGAHVFCEKPFCLNYQVSNELAEIAERKGLVNQVGYHYRFVAAFREMKRLLDRGAIGPVSHVLAEAYGPVALRSKGMSWRSQKEEGGGCLYDYAAHPINLLNWFFGMPTSVTGTVLGSVFSRETDDEVYGTLRYEKGPSAQISVNWSDESYRKMTVKVTAWGAAGKLYADRQECQAFLRTDAPDIEGYTKGWNVRYTTELTDPVWFYVRGEEYSAQVDYFIQCILAGKRENLNSFASAAKTDQVLSMLQDDAAGVSKAPVAAVETPERKQFFFRRPLRQRTV
jgi:predicted dehydrogenase